MDLDTRINCLEDRLVAELTKVKKLEDRWHKIQADFSKAILSAAGAGDSPRLQFLIENCKRWPSLNIIDVEDEKRMTPIILATIGGHLEAVRLLLRAGAHSQPLPGFEHTGLRAAALFGQEDIAMLLLAHGADPNSQSAGGRTPLMASCLPRQFVGLEQSKRILQLLLRAGAAVNDQNDLGETALFLAASRGHREQCEILLTAGADPNIRNKEGLRASEVASNDAALVFTRFTSPLQLP